MTRPAVFLDRDGVIVEDRDVLVDASELRVLDGVAEAIARLRRSGRAIVVVSNQPVVARGLVSERGIEQIHEALDAMLRAGGAVIDRFYFCPHHPNATLEAYRVACECRKPRPGLLQKAARDLDLDLGASVMVGDRLSDVAAGKRAGCRAVLVESGKHTAPPIESPDGPSRVEPDHSCASLAAAVDWMLR